VSVREFKFEDPTWFITNTDLWSSIEFSLGIVCACAPLLGPIFAHVSHLIKVIVSSRPPSCVQKTGGQSSRPRLIERYEDSYPLNALKTSTIIESGASVKGSKVYGDHEHGEELGWIQVRRDWQVRHA